MRRAIAHAIDRKAFVDGAILGLLNSSGLVLQVFGQVYTSASRSAFITSLNTPLEPLVGFLFYQGKPTRPQLAAVAIATRRKPAEHVRT